MSKLISILFLFLTCSLYAQGDVVGKGGWKVVAIGTPDESKINDGTSEQDFSATIYTIPANALADNKVYRVTLGYEHVVGVSTATVIVYFELGGTKVITMPTNDIVNSTTRSGAMVFYIHGTAAAAASANVEIMLTSLITNTGATNTVNQPVTLATDGALPMVFGVQYSATGSTETMTFKTYIVEQLN